MGTKSKKLISVLMMFLICAVTVFGNVQTAKAAENETLLVEQYGTALANTEVSHNFTTDVNEEVVFYLYAPAAGDYTFTVNDNGGNVYDTFSVTASEWIYVEELQAYGYAFTLPYMPAGDYVFKFTTTVDTEYLLYISSVAPQPVLNQKTATVSVGMKVTLKVDNTKEAITWKSSNKKIATVSNKGVVTGKKKGTATITATTESGVELKCKVTVKNNKYSETKSTTANLSYGNAIVQVYSASYNSDGDLVLKCRFINNSGVKVSALEGLKITFKTDENKTIGTYSTTKKTMNVAHGATKDFTVKIKKSKLKIKKADLRNSTYKVSGKYVYYY